MPLRQFGMNTARIAEYLAVKRAVSCDDQDQTVSGLTALAASTGAGEWDQGDVSGTLDRYRQRSLMASACPKLAARLDLAALSDMPSKACNILVVNMIDIVDAKRANLAPWRVPSTTWPPSTGTAAWPATSSLALATLALWATKSAARTSTAAVAFTSWTGWAPETRALGSTFTAGTAATVAVVRTV